MEKLSVGTIELLRAKGAKGVLLAQFGRPKGKSHLKYSRPPIADQIIPPPTDFSPEVVGPNVKAPSKGLPDNGYNWLRKCDFSQEKKERGQLRSSPGKLGDVDGNDAFGGGSPSARQYGWSSKILPQEELRREVLPGSRPRGIGNWAL